MSDSSKPISHMEETQEKIMQILLESYKDADNFLFDMSRAGLMVYHSRTMVSLDVLNKLATVTKVIGIQANNSRKLFDRGFELSVFLKEKTN